MKKLSILVLLSSMLGGFAMLAAFADQATFDSARWKVLSEKLDLSEIQ
jgi:hypothetical protein